MHEAQNVYELGVRQVRSLQIGLLLLMVIVLTVVPIHPREAYACSCALPQTDADFQRIIDAYDLVLVGSIAAPDPESPYPDKVHIAVEKVYKGPALRDVTLDQPIDLATNPSALIERQVEVLGPDCSYALLGQPGERYLLFLKTRPNGTYEPGGCSSNSLQSGQADTYLDPLERLTGVGPPAAPPSVGAGYPTATSGVWLIPLLMTAGAVTGAAGLILLTTRRRGARP